MSESGSTQQRWSSTQVGAAVFTVVGAALLLTAVGLATEIFLILFLGLLFSVFLAGSSQLLAHHSPMNYLGSLAIVTGTLGLLMLLGLFLFGVQVDKQITVASEHADEGVQQIQTWAKQYPSVRSVLRSTPFLREMVEPEDLEKIKLTNDESQEIFSNGKEGQNAGEERSVSTESEDAESKEKKEKSSQAEIAEQSAMRTTVKHGAGAIAKVFQTTFGLLVNSLLIFFVGLFLALAPHDYRDGVVKMFPLTRRERTREVMDMMGDTLWDWLLGRFATMLITGVGAGLLLAVLGVPLAATLGVTTAFLTFIPNIGSFIALALAILFALPEGGNTVLLVFFGYLALQLVESYVVTPLIQQRQASLPPALLISTQAVMGVLFGFLGAAVASPLLAATKVAVEEAYVKDVLESGSSD